jgi:hypothetical protein
MLKLWRKNFTSRSWNRGSFVSLGQFILWQAAVMLCAMRTNILWLKYNNNIKQHLHANILLVKILHITKMYRRAIKWMRQLVLSPSNGISTKHAISTVRITLHLKRDAAYVNKNQLHVQPSQLPTSPAVRWLIQLLINKLILPLEPEGSTLLIAYYQNHYSDPELSSVYLPTLNTHLNAICPSLPLKPANDSVPRKFAQNAFLALLSHYIYMPTPSFQDSADLHINRRNIQNGK